MDRDTKLIFLMNDLWEKQIATKGMDIIPHHHPHVSMRKGMFSVTQRPSLMLRLHPLHLQPFFM